MLFALNEWVWNEYINLSKWTHKLAAGALATTWVHTDIYIPPSQKKENKNNWIVFIVLHHQKFIDSFSPSMLAASLSHLCQSIRGDRLTVVTVNTKWKNISVCPLDTITHSCRLPSWVLHTSGACHFQILSSVAPTIINSWATSRKVNELFDELLSTFVKQHQHCRPLTQYFLLGEQLLSLNETKH